MAGSKTVAVSNLKGGAGKSTTTINLASAAQMAGIQTAIIDIDPEQQASARWSDARKLTGNAGADRPRVVSAVHTRLLQSMAELERAGTELIFVDCPAFVPAYTTEAVKVADLVLIPCRTTVQDLQYLATTIDIAAAWQKPAAVVLNSVESQLRETEGARAFIAKIGVALAPFHLSKAVAYHRAITAGLGVTEFEPTGKAAQEILSLLEWTSGLLHLSMGPRSEEPVLSRAGA